jgi:nitroreductase
LNYSDEGRNLAALDPFRRELYMGLGCSTENASVAAPSQGTNANVVLLPGDPGQRGLAAAIQLQASNISRHPHHDAIALRHTHWGPYRLDRPIAQDTLSALTRQISSPDTKLLFVEAASPEGKTLSGLMIEATARILETPALLEGRHRGLRIASAPNGDNTEAALKKADAAWLETTRTVHLATAPVFGLIMVRGARADHVLHMEAGRLWQRLHLEGTLQGLAMQPLNHLIEVIDHESFGSQQSMTRERMNLAADWKGWEPIFGFQLGYADAAAPRSPRRPLSIVVIG